MTVCKNCKGVGYIIAEDRYSSYHTECWECNGKGVVEPLTNEEWLRNANDEELCELLLKIAFMCAACGVSVFEKRHSCIVDDECLAIKNGYCMYCSATKTMEWLKQPHKE